MAFQDGVCLLKEASIAYNQWKSNVFECLDKTKYQHKVNLFVNQLFRTLENGEITVEPGIILPVPLRPWGYGPCCRLFRQGMQIYPIYGEPGCGTREVMRRIAQIAQWQGYFTEDSTALLSPKSWIWCSYSRLNAAVISIWEPVRSSIPDVAE